MSSTVPFETAIAAHALEDPTREVCGFVVIRGTHLEAIRTPNSADDPTRFFRIDPVLTLDRLKAGDLAGYYHSHPHGPAEASAADKAVAAELKLPAWIYSVEDGALVMHKPATFYAPLEGRPFCPCVHDCVALVWDFARDWMNVELPSFPRGSGDYCNGVELDWQPWIDELGGKIVTSPRAGDVLIMKCGDTSRPNHLGVMLPGGVFIHQRSNQTSGREVYGGYWKKNTLITVRLPGAEEAAARYDAVGGAQNPPGEPLSAGNAANSTT